jgi:hypothetical protein
MEIQLTHPLLKSFKSEKTARKKISDILISEEEQFAIVQGQNGRFYAVVICAFESNMPFYAQNGFRVIGVMGDK